MKTWIIYCHTNLINNKKYIGLTHFVNNPNTRWCNGKGYHKVHHKIFAAAIAKYGWENFSHEILEENIKTLEEANEREKYWIAYYHTYIGDPECNGYNATIGGDGNPGRVMSEAEKEYRRQLRLGTHASEETKQKMSKTRRGKPQHMTAKKKAQLDKMHQNWAGQHQSEEAIEKIRLASLGRTHTEETKSKISQTKKANPNHTTRPGSGVKKAVRCIETGIIYSSLTAASLATAIAKSSIMACAKGQRKIAGGYHWEYYFKNEEELKENLNLLSEENK